MYIRHCVAPKQHFLRKMEKAEFLRSSQCSLHGCLDNSIQKTQTCRNLMLCHRNWYECGAAPPQHTYTLTVSLYDSTSLILSLYSPLIHVYFYSSKINPSTGSVLFRKMSLFISHSLLFFHFSINEIIHNSFAL